MKKICILLVSVLVANVAIADNLFQTNNPFPQTSPQSMNNIYESEPAVMQQEVKQAKKSRFRKGKNLQQETQGSSNFVIPGTKVINEGSEDSNFYNFK